MCIYWRWVSIILVCGAIGLPGPAFAEDTVIPAASNAIPANDGPLPIYLGVSPPANGFPANFWSSGAYRLMPALELYSQIEPAAVDARYRPRLANRTRTTNSANGLHVTKFEGPGALVKVPLGVQSVLGGAHPAVWAKVFETMREGCHTNKRRRIWGVHE